MTARPRCVATDACTGMITAMRLVMLSLTIFLLVAQSRRKVGAFWLLRLLRWLRICVVSVMVVVMVMMVMMKLASDRDNRWSPHRNRHIFGVLSNGLRTLFARGLLVVDVTAAAANRNCHLIIGRRRNNQIIRFRFGRMIGASIFGGTNARITALRVPHGSGNFTI